MSLLAEVPVHPEHWAEVEADEGKKEILAACALSFRRFLDYWCFVDQESGKQRILGEVIWEGQEQMIEAMETVDKVFALKARKLGFTTLEIGFDAWVARFRDSNARVHLFSRREDAAHELLEAVRYGLDRLPEWMKLPYDTTPTKTELRMRAGPDDVRIVKSYPTSEETAVEKTATHGHVDEWARMKNPRLVWQAIEPTMARTCHIITTGRGPINFASGFWKDTLAGDTEFVGIFVPALERDDRDAAWLANKRKGMTEEAFRHEYPQTWEDALFAGGRFTFRTVDVDAAGTGVGPSKAATGHRYVKAWDIGRHHDAAVGIVLDATVSPVQVVHYTRLRGIPYPALQRRIEAIHAKYPGVTVIEKNSAGEAVAENLIMRPSQLILFWTGPQSKPKIIEGLNIELENRRIRWDRSTWYQLDVEVRGYQVPDDEIVQDSVIALAIGVEHLGAVYTAGRVGRVVGWS